MRLHLKGTRLSLRTVPILLAVIVSVAVCLAVAVRPHHMSAPAPAKLWSIDLNVDVDFRKRGSISEVSLNAPSINFIDESHLICAFYGGESIGYNPSLTPSDYHILEIDTTGGRLGRKLNFQSVDDHSRTLPVADGGFVVLAGGELRKFSSEFLPDARYPTPIESPNQRPDLWLVDVVPSGRSLLLYFHRTGEAQGIWTWLNTQDLSRIRSVPGPLITAAKASDRSGIVAPEGMEDSLFSGQESSRICSHCNASFLTNDLLFLAWEHSYAIQSVAGKKHGSGDLDVWADNFTKSADSTRFAYSTGHYSGSGFPIQTHFDGVSARTIVIDWSTNKPLAEVDINEPTTNPSAGLTQMALALSPTGKLLAVLVHHTLTVYRIS